MVHGRSRDETAGKIETIRATLGRSLRASDVLYSTREFKKVRVRYFTQDEAQWEAARQEVLA